jgi:branched-chain amino acid transport system permease protein
MITGVVTARLRRLPIGRAWEALREDEIACRSLGINTRNTKLTAFATGAMFAGFAGSFFATRQGFISPESFVAMESFIILAVVVLGGLGSMLGIVIAVIFLNTVFELRDLAEYRMLIVGFAMVAIMVWRPRGLISTRKPTVYLRSRKTVPADLVAEGRA